MKITLSVFLLASFVGLALSQRYGGHHSNRNRYRCNSPSRPQYGGYDGDDDYYGIGHKVTYYCKDGYKLYGSQYSTCKYSSRSYRGYWDNSTPYCKRIRKTCSKLDAPDNGIVKLTGVNPGDKATYNCNRGYNLVGSKKRKCQNNGKWSNSAPICKPVDCGQPDAANSNGAVRVEETTLGNSAYYTCDRGYILVGSATVTCLYTAEWSDTAPICQPVDCGQPDPANSNGAVRVEETTLGNSAYYTCDRGYILVGSATVTCLYTAEWSDTAPICQPVDCGSLDAPKYGTVLHVPDTVLGSRAIFSCKKGFKLDGKKVLRCLYTGEYSAEPPTCKRTSCPKLSAPVNGRIHVSGYYPNDYVYYKCNYGYSFKGSSRRVCNKKGRWTGSNPKCVKDYYPDDHYYDDKYRG